MDGYDLFKSEIKKKVEAFKAIDKNEVIRIISHLDCDGVCASSILIKALDNDNRKYSISIVQQLSKPFLNELSNEDYNVYFFTDLGSGHADEISELMGKKKVFILDHHEIKKKEDSGIFHINPHLYGLNGSKEVSGSGVVFYFCTELNKKNEDMAHLAIIGAIGDVQEENGFLPLNNEILEIAKKKKKIKVIKGLRIFGAQTKPLHKVLEYCTDPLIPGVTGSESGSIQFLKQLDINPKNENGWNKIVHLSNEELKKLSTGIILRRLNETNPEDILGNVYILPEEEKESPFRDVKEFSTLLNACGRLGKASLGIGVCLGNKKIKKKSIEHLKDYRKEIMKAMRWYEENKNSKNVVNGNGFIIINALDNIMPSMVGTFASILSKSKEFEQNTHILALAQSIDNTTKVSLRASGNRKNVDLIGTIKEIAEKIEGAEAGGHCNAAGAIIPTDQEEEFIKIASETLTNKALK